MRPARALGRGQLRELERRLRSTRARLERSMERTRARRIAQRLCGAPDERSEAGSARGATPSADTLAQHQELVAAIRRVEAGTYGICSVCEGAIEYERLVRDPRATHCAKCAARDTVG